MNDFKDQIYSRIQQKVQTFLSLQALKYITDDVNVISIYMQQFTVHLNLVYKLCITESSYNPRPEKTKGEQKMFKVLRLSIQKYSLHNAMKVCLAHCNIYKSYIQINYSSSHLRVFSFSFEVSLMNRLFLITVLEYKQAKQRGPAAQSQTLPAISLTLAENRPVAQVAGVSTD